ncbi:MAG: ATP-binding protein [Chlamydiota bacterium]|nr:ATP-binding protein [Chlamydiota bacterium]
MSLYASITGLTSLTFFLTGLYVYMQNIHRLLYKRCFIFSASVALWAFGYFITLLEAPNYQINIIASRFSHSFGAFIPITYLHFVWAILKRSQRKKLFFWSYLFSAFMFLMCFTPLVVKELLPKMEFQFYPEWGLLYPVYSALYVVFPGYAQYEMAVEITRTKGTERTRLIYFFIALALAFSGGVSLFLLIFNVQFPPYSSAMIILYPPMMAYTILVYRFMDIEIIIKKTIVFAGIVAAAVAAIAFPFALIQAVIGQALGAPHPLLLAALAIATTVLIYRPVERILVNITDKYLFQKKEEIKVILRNLSEKVMTLLDLKQVGQTILTTLVETFRLESGVIAVYDKKSSDYQISENIGFQPQEFVQAVKQYFSEPEVTQYFSDHPSFIVLDHIDTDELPKSVLEWLKKAKARVCIPLSIDENQSGFLILGKKKSDREFTKDEADFFSTIASQVSLAIQKTSLLQAVVEEREAKVQAEHLAKRVKFAGLIKHEIQNKLVHIQMPANATSAYCIPRLKKWFKEQNEKRFSEICDEVAKGSKDINLAADHIRIIALTARSGVDESEKSFEELDFKLIWEDAKEEIGLLKRCDFESKMPQRFYVYANFHALQRTLVNLIRNAFDAMKDKDKPLIKLRCSYENMEGKNVAYFEVEDSGCGIPGEVQNKIFEDGFSTKAKPDAKDMLSSGHGQGLAACRLYIENVHNGNIWFETEAGKGTIFKFWVPTPPEETKNQG